MILTIITWHFGWQPSPEAVAEGGGHPPGLGSQHALPIWRTVPRASAERIFLFTASAEQIPQEASVWRQADLIMAGHHLAHPVLVYRVRIFEVHIITIWFDTLWASVITRSSTARSRGYVITETVWECLDLWLAVSQSPFLHTCCHEGRRRGLSRGREKRGPTAGKSLSPLRPAPAVTTPEFISHGSRQVSHPHM